MITVINYGLGNINAFLNVYKRLNIPAKIASSNDELVHAEKILLPGVGAFDHAMDMLNRSGMRPLLDELVTLKKIPVLGICVGMQMFSAKSEEGTLPGLCWIDGEVKRFNLSMFEYPARLPHMGWNTITIVKDNTLLYGLTAESRFYFLHSYYFVCNQTSDVLTTTSYGIEYTSALNNENIYGLQFHPEKSHSAGIQVLKNFANL